MPNTQLTHDQLNNTNKPELLKLSHKLLDDLIASDQRNEQFENILTELKNLKDSHEKAENNHRKFEETSRAANAALTDEIGKLRTRLTATEKEHNQLAQYSRRFHLELGTQNKSLKDSADLTKTVAELLSETGVRVQASDLDVCHVVGKKENGRVIMELKNRDLRYKILKNRKNLKDVEVPIHGKLYINESMCPQYKQLDFICRTLRGKDYKRIHSTWLYNGRLWVVEEEGDAKQHIGHTQDLYNLFGVETVDRILKK